MTAEMASPARKLEELQEKEVQLLEKDSHSLDDIIEYWRTVKDINLLLFAARMRGITELGGQRVPSRLSSSKNAKDAILMVLLAEQLARSPFRNRKWDLADWSPVLYKSPPEGLKADPQRVTVTYCDDPETETEYAFFGTLLTYDHLTQTWVKGTSGVDDEGLWVRHDGDRHPTHYLKWRDEAGRYCLVGQETWEIRGGGGRVRHPRAEQAPPETPVARPRTPPITRGSVQAPRAPRKTRSARDPLRGIQGVRPEDVGKRKTIPVRGGGKRTRLQQLIIEAEDPPGLLFEGKTSQLKTIRQRICSGQYAFQNVSTTWHWVGRPGDPSKVLMLFDSNDQRDTFVQTFKTEASGVRVFNVSVSGI